MFTYKVEVHENDLKPNNSNTVKYSPVGSHLFRIRIWHTDVQQIFGRRKWQNMIDKKSNSLFNRHG